MKRYEKYKNGGEAWVKKMPVGWKSLPAKRLFECIKIKNAEKTENNVLSLTLKGVIKNDIDNPVGLVPADYSSYQIFEKDNLVFKLIDLENTSTSRVGIVPERGIMSSAYIRFEAKKEFNIRYFYLQYFDWWKRNIFNGLGAGVRQTLSAKDLLNLKILVPPRDEQDQIVRYLDWKTSKIDSLIRGYEKQIELLKERKIAVIDKAVTKGLNPNMPMKHSGTNWMGDIPHHWEIKKLRYVLKPVSIKNHPELPLLSVYREKGVIIRDVTDKEANHNYIPDDLSGYKLVKKGQFVINKMKAWQGSYGVSDYTGIISPAYFIFDIIFDNLEYFHYLIRSKIYVTFFACASDGIRSGQWDLQMDRLNEIPLIIPPVNEQIAVIDYIKKIVPKYDFAIKKLAIGIALLEEYKTKLISDVVTGQIDVRGEAVPDYIADNFTEVENEISIDENEEILNADQY